MPRLVRKANVKHIVHNYEQRRQIDDEEIYKIAVDDNRFVVTINYKDFKRLVKKGAPGIIALPSDLTIEGIEEILLRFTRENKPSDCVGKAIKLSIPLLY